MRTILLLLVISLILIECKKNDPGPVVNQEWFNATVADISKSSIGKMSYIVKADYEGTCVVYVNNCCPNCSTAIILYRCDDGTKVEDADLSKLTNQATIWQPGDSECLMN